MLQLLQNVPGNMKHIPHGEIPQAEEMGRGGAVGWVTLRVRWEVHRPHLWDLVLPDGDDRLIQSFVGSLIH